jgi:hypothetical protein
MSVAVDDSPILEASSGQSSGHIRFRNVLASEWIKLVSVRSTVWALVVTAVVGIGLGAVVTSAQAARYSARTLAAQQAFDPTRSSLSGILFAQLAIGVLGVLIVSAEYSTGTVRATFAAIPHRPVVLAAKALVFSAITFVVGEAVSIVAFVIGQVHSLGPHSHRVAVRPERAVCRHRRRSVPRRARTLRARARDDHPSHRRVHPHLCRLALRAPDHRGRSPVIVF